MSEIDLNVLRDWGLRVVRLRSMEIKTTGIRTTQIKDGLRSD